MPACLPPGSSCTPPSVTTTVIDCPVIGEPYSFQIQVAGNGPMTFVETAGSWPGGITMSSSGLLTGTPTDFGTGNVTVEVTGQCGTDTATIENCQPPAMFRWTLMSELMSSGAFATNPTNAFYEYGGEQNLSNIPAYADHPVTSESRPTIRKTGGYPITKTGDGNLVSGTSTSVGLGFLTVPDGGTVTRTVNFPAVTSDPSGGINCGIPKEIIFNYRTNVRNSLRIENLDPFPVVAEAVATVSSAITLGDLPFSNVGRCSANSAVTAFDGTVDFGGPTGNAGSGFSVPGLNGFTASTTTIVRPSTATEPWRKLVGNYGSVIVTQVIHTGATQALSWQTPLAAGPYGTNVEITQPPETSLTPNLFYQSLITGGNDFSLQGRRLISEGKLWIGYDIRIGNPRPIDGFTDLASGAIIRMQGDVGYGTVNGHGILLTGHPEGSVVDTVFVSQHSFFAGTTQSFQINPEGLNPAIAIPTNGRVYHGLIADASFLDPDLWKLIILNTLVLNDEGLVAATGNPGNVRSIPNAPVVVSSVPNFTKPGGYPVTMTTSATRLFGNATVTSTVNVTALPGTTTHNIGAFSEGGLALVGGYLDYVYGRLERVVATLQSQFVGSVQYENLDAATTVVQHGMGGTATFTIGSYAGFQAVGGTITTNLTGYDGFTNNSGTSGFGSVAVQYGAASTTITFDRLTTPTDVWDEFHSGSGSNLSITRVGDTPSFTFSQSPTTTSSGPTLGIRQIRTTGTNFEYRYENSQGYLVVAWYVRLGIPSSITKLSDSSVIPMAPLGSWGSIDLGPFGVEIIRDLYERGGEEMYVARSANQVFASDGNLDFQINH